MASLTLIVPAMHAPGHKPACATHVTGNAAFVVDTWFMPDDGTARTDFPDFDAQTPFRSVRNIPETLPPGHAFKQAIAEAGRNSAQKT